MRLAAALLVRAAVSLAASRGQGGRVAGAFLLAAGVAALVNPVLLVRLCRWDEEEATCGTSRHDNRITSVTYLTA
jgi:hypothetical protein